MGAFSPPHDFPKKVPFEANFIWNVFDNVAWGYPLPKCSQLMAPLSDDDGNSGGGIPVKTRMKRILFTRKKSIKIGNAVNFSRCTICTKLH